LPDIFMGKEHFHKPFSVDQVIVLENHCLFSAALFLTDCLIQRSYIDTINITFPLPGFSSRFTVPQQTYFCRLRLCRLYEYLSSIYLKETFRTACTGPFLC